MNQEFLKIQNLEFSYPQAKQLTLSIDHLSVSEKEKIFLYGPSGCGKTTFLELLAGILSANKGQVIVAGQNLAEMSSSERDDFRSCNIGYIFQNFNLLTYLNVIENIELPLRFSKKYSSLHKQLILDITEKLQIKDLLLRKANQLSVGQQQRVAVARAIAMQPKLILSDEPTSALDADNRKKFLDLLFEICSQFGITLIFVSHDQSIRSQFDRAVSFKELNKTNL